ncbi:glycosyltransferase family 18 protein [Hebeloma cylindrosporum]|uniref:Glycosyltransferase family 18 protein n=1 Tax=Hebeloma cylindrosporum TaxID=76867 RepID=A0A0C2Y951_HEBCY|nr:glycosyltransferase family 18 protein [Hebeloma cylindrosporum h7]
MGRTRIGVLVVCGIIPTLFLLSLQALRLSSHSFNLPFFRKHTVSQVTEAGPLIPPSTSSTNPHAITNNNATYPRINLNGDYLSYRAQARAQLARIEAHGETLFNGEDWNKWQMEQLVAYLRKAETEVDYVPPRVVLTSWHWVPCAYGECTTGEVQWIRPLVDIMKRHNIIYLFSPTWMGLAGLKKDLSILGNDLVTHIWADDEHVVRCFNDERCIQDDQNPDGIPAWKLFAFTFWGSKPNAIQWNSTSDPWSFNPLGSEWNLVPYQMPEKQFFLGYYYQGCESLEYIPHEARKDQVLILAKRSKYFHEFPAFDPTTFFTDLRNHTRHELVSTAAQEDGFPIPDGLTSLGLMSKADYDHLLANTKALIGVGKPIISPTPYASLCRGVPVILPYHSEFVLMGNPKTCGPHPDSSTWCGFLEEAHQHGPASTIGPPYVYTVDVKSPIETILEVVDLALRTPIQPYVPPEMKPEAVEKRLLDYFAIDWERYAYERVRERGLSNSTSSGFGNLELPDFLKEWVRTHPESLIRRDVY